MAWTGKITKVDKFYGAVNVTVTISQDSPAVSYTTSVGFNTALEIDWTRIQNWIKAEIARVSAVHAAGVLMDAHVNEVVTP